MANSELMRVSQAEYQEWQRSPVTQELVRVLKVFRQEYSERLAQGSTIRERSDMTAQETARIVGVVFGIDLVLEMKVEEE